MTIAIDAPSFARDEARTRDRSGALAVPAVRGPAWGIATRAAIIYALPQFFGFIHLAPAEWISRRIHTVWEAGHPFFNQYVLRLPPSAQDPDSFAGARSHVVYMIVFSLVVGGIWYLLERARRHEALIHETARLLCRYALAGMLLSYAGEKFWTNQGSQGVDPTTLIRSFGEMGGFFTMMAWLSYSTLYATFAGLAEAVGGLMLFSRRWTPLGAILCLADMAMVWLINKAYWGSPAWTPLVFVPMSLFLIAPDMARLFEFFVRNRPTALQVDRLVPSPWVRRLGIGAKCLMVPYALYAFNIPFAYRVMFKEGYTTLAGVYHVEEFERNGQTEPLSSAFPNRWREFAIDRIPILYFAIRTVDDKSMDLYPKWPSYDLKEIADLSAAKEGVLHFSSGAIRQRGQPYDNMRTLPGDSLRYAWVAPDVLTLEGNVAGDAIRARLHRIPLRSQPFFQIRWTPLRGWP